MLSPGTRFGDLEVVAYMGCNAVHVRCECGKEKVVQAVHLRHGKTLSCGCLRARQLSERRLSHGMSGSREYRAWLHMRQRCRLSSHIQFADYGGRGIRVCEEWDRSFQAFLRDMGHCPPGHSIDRVENDGNYERGNCRWATSIEQSNNQRRNVTVEHGGRVQTIAQWARELGLRYATLHRRVVIKGEAPDVAFRALA